MIPPVTKLQQRDTARLIPSKYSVTDDSVLTRIANDDDHLQILFELDGLANDRLRAQADQLPGIAAQELVTDTPYASIVNAAFCHANPTGARFNGPDRGAWYASFAAQTSLAEVHFHHALWLQETKHFFDSITYDTYLADFDATFHDIRNLPEFKDCLASDDYRKAQSLAVDLRDAGSAGVIYPSARADGDCIVCFQPKQVTNVRKTTTYRLTWSGEPQATITRET